MSTFRNASLNIAAQAAGMLIAFLATPFVVRQLGNSEFGLLSILWALIGYFSVFDLGTGVGVLKFLPDSLAKGEKSRVVTIIKSSLITSLGIGVIATVLACGLAWVGIQHFTTISASYQMEAERMFYYLSLGLPALLVQVSLRSVMMSYNRYDIVNAAQFVTGLLQWGGSVLVVALGGRIFAVVILTVLARYLVVSGLVVCMLRLVPGFLHQKGERYREVFLEFLRFGGWASVPQVISPLLILAERVIIGILLSLAAVPFFSIPNDTVFRLLFVPVGIVSAVIPELSAAWALRETRWQAVKKYYQAVRLVALVMAPACIALAIGAWPLLRFWMGLEFADHASFVMAALAIGLIFNSVSQVPSAFLLSVGRPDLSGKLLAAELLVYTLMLFFFTSWWGIPGSAIAWACRVFLEMVAFLWLSQRCIRREPLSTVSAEHHTVRWGMAAIGLTVAIAGALLPWPWWTAAGTAIGGLALYVFAAWNYLLTTSERSAVRSALQVAGVSVGTNQG